MLQIVFIYDFIMLPFKLFKKKQIVDTTFIKNTPLFLRHIRYVFLYNYSLTTLVV